MITHPFKSQETLNKMLTLRAKGWTYKSLASVYGVDHSSIYHQCKKNGVKLIIPMVSFNVSDIIGLFDNSKFINSILAISIRKKPTSYLDYLKQ